MKEKSLENRLEIIDKIKTGIQESEKIINQSPEKAYRYAEESYKLAVLQKESYLEATSLFCMGRSEWIKGRFEEAMHILSNSIEIGMENKYYDILSKSYNLMGNIYLDLEKYDMGLECYIKAIKEAEKTKEIVLKSNALNNIGEIYRKLKDYEQAIKYYKESIDIEEHEENKNNAAVGILNIGDVYFSLKEYILARYYASKSLAIFEKYNNIQGIGYSNHLLGLIENAEGNYEQAKNYYSRAMAYYVEVEDKVHQIEVLTDMGKLYIHRGDEYTALANINEAYILAEKIKLTNKEAEICSILANLYEANKEYENALRYYKKFHDITQIVEKERSEMKLNVVLSQFSTEQSIKEKEIYKTKNIQLKNKAKELEIAYKRIATITEIGRELTATLDLEQIVNILYIHINKLMDVHFFGMGLYNETDKVIEYRLSIEKGERIPAFKVDIEDKNSLAAWCIRNRKEVNISDSDKEEHKYTESGLTRLPTGRGKVVSIIYLPIVFEDNVIGIMTVQSSKKQAYTSNHMEILKALASFVAIAINNSQKSYALEKEIKERKETEAILQRLNNKLLELSNLDGLTGIPNRRHLDSYLNNIIQDKTLGIFALTVIIVDIDYFKQFNDNYGHIAGDDVIKQVANLLKVSLKRETDLLARYGGDEFIIFLPNTKIEGIQHIIVDIFSQMKDINIEHRASEASDRVTLTLGVAISDNGINGDINYLIDLADKALYQAKSEGRNGYKILKSEGWNA